MHGRIFGTILISVVIMYLPQSCEKQEHIFGLVLMVDDGYIDQWHEIIDYLDQYDAKLSFYISSYHNLSENQIQKLQAFNDRDYEIGYHGTHHIDASAYLTNHTCNEYLEYEILPDLALMQQAGFSVKHFAYPYGCDNMQSDSLLLAYFISVRKLAWTSQKITLPNQNKVFYKAPVAQNLLWAAGIDDAYNLPIKDIEQAIDRIEENQECLLLYCHRLCDEEGKYNISVEKVKSIIEYCYYMNVPMITVSDLFEFK